MNAMAVNPTISATAQLISFAQRKLFLLSAISGSDEWPSCEMLLAKSTGSGTMPVAYNVTKIMCGPDSGMMPISVARIIIRAVLLLIHASILIYWSPMPTISNIPKVQQNIVKRCLRIMWFHMCSSMKWSDAKSSTKSTITLSPAKRTFIHCSSRRLIDVDPSLRSG